MTPFEQRLFLCTTIAILLILLVALLAVVLHHLHAPVQVEPMGWMA